MLFGCRLFHRASPCGYRATVVRLHYVAARCFGHTAGNARDTNEANFFDGRLLPSVVDAIGSTPLIELSRFTAASGIPPGGGRIVAKLESTNPGLSKKDRIARQIIEDAREDGTLKPGQPVVELTSGNTGTGLAIVCNVLGHPFSAVMSRGNSLERARMMRALGAEVVLVDQCAGSVLGQVSGADLQAVEQVAERLVAERGAFRADQFHHFGSFRAHYLYTGPEAWWQASGGRPGGGSHPIDAFVDFVGSGGSFAGVAAFLKERTDGHALCWVVEPIGAPTLAQGPAAVVAPGHRIQGGGYSRGWGELKLMNQEHVDNYVSVRDDQAIDCARRLAREEGIFGGFSSGANAHAALQLLRSDAGRGRTVLMMICDSGLKYLSTDLWPE